MRCYYFECALTDNELSEVAQLMECAVEQVRIPYLLPEERGAFTEQRSELEIDTAGGLLRSAQIERDYGRRCLFVIPADMRWNYAFSAAIHRITGFFPFTVQTSTQRERIGNPGDLRIIDMQGMME